MPRFKNIRRMTSPASFDALFQGLTGHPPFRWQTRLYQEWFAKGEVPAACDIPTGFGKTNIIALWLIGHIAGARLPRRLVYVVDRRAVVDQATEVAEKLRGALSNLPPLAAQLGLEADGLAISTLRGQFADNRKWLENPAAPAIIVGTVDMVGSRLLFSGYGVSRKMRPYHAGLLGVDTLVVLDEAHLVPPFERLLETIEGGTQAYGPRDERDRHAVPAFRLLSLSATGRDRDGEIFRITGNDIDDVGHLLNARKSVTLVPLDGGKLEDALAAQAWTLADAGRAAKRCLVYCDSRETAEKTLKAIEKLAAGDRSKGIAKVGISTELFVGARRVMEREGAKNWLQTHGFLAGSSPPTQPAFLVATSAGEVGVDLDADHMVCDLVPWERMVQRLGRVNRRGNGDASVIVIDPGEPKPQKEEPTAAETRAAISRRSLALLTALPPSASGYDASPGALRNLKLRSDLKDRIAAATTPPPLRPALTRALVDAWAMTSLEEHTGRPEIAPWLRGWVDEDPQTAVVWRKYLPIRDSGGPVSQVEIDGFFEAAPPHISERLESETWRVAEWLVARSLGAPGLASDSVIAFTLEDRRAYTLREIAESTSKNAKVKIVRELSGATLVVDARLGGLSSAGLLDAGYEVAPATADSDNDWIGADESGRPAVGFRIHPPDRPDAAHAAAADAFIFATRRSGDGDDEQVVVIESWSTEESRAASSREQLLIEHQVWTDESARAIARAVGLPTDHATTLSIAARLHDEGKRAARWQRAFNARRERDEQGRWRVFAKTSGPLRTAWLDGYRHEFGSLPWAEKDAEFCALPPDARELVLHLIAAHHGQARPVISVQGCEDAPPTDLQQRARDVALRFARLQRRWGPWGLAWWEALLRAADQQASRKNDALGSRAKVATGGSNG